MKTIKIADMTLCRNAASLSFKERIEIARLLENGNIDVIELPAIGNVRTDTLLVRTVSSFVKKSVLSVEAGMSVSGVENAAAALSGAEHPRIRVELPVSAVGMEYTCHKKAPKMLAFITELITAAKEKCADVEFCAVDATRAEEAFLTDAVAAAVAAGAQTVTFCDTAGEMLPDDFAAFTAGLSEKIPALAGCETGVVCEDKNGMAAAAAVLAVRAGASLVKTAVSGGVTPLETFAGIVRNCGTACGFSAGIKLTELNRIVRQIARIAGTGAPAADATAAAPAAGDGSIRLDANDDQAAVVAAVRQLGYDLSEEDCGKVYEEFGRVAAKKTVGAKELDAIVASAALQVPPTYQLVSYVINNGNIISASAQIRLRKGDGEIDGICIGDGPIDASFRAIEQIIGHHYELDDFQIQAVTEGREAMGAALVKLREGGRLYSGNGISTDIIGASIRAYLSALNKIVYEEA